MYYDDLRKILFFVNTFNKKLLQFSFLFTKTLRFILLGIGIFNFDFWWFQGGGDTDADGREKGDPTEIASTFEEDKSPEMKLGDEGDPSIGNARGLLNGMDRDCKDFMYDKFVCR